MIDVIQNVQGGFSFLSQSTFLVPTKKYCTLNKWHIKISKLVFWDKGLHFDLSLKPDLYPSIISHSPPPPTHQPTRQPLHPHKVNYIDNSAVRYSAFYTKFLML